MKNILLHGLLQTPSSWKVIQSQLQEKQIDSQCPNLFQMTQEKTYQNLFNEFTNFCNNQKGKLNLCGLSFGGILALEYAKKFPEKVNSLIIINVPYTIPKILFQIQNIIFHFMPKKVFQKVGMTKKEFNRMMNLETILYSFKSLLYGIIIGIILSYLIHLSIKNKFDKVFEIPYIPIIISIIFVFLIVFIIMRYSISKVNKKNTIETIRSENI